LSQVEALSLVQPMNEDCEMQQCGCSRRSPGKK